MAGSSRSMARVRSTQMSTTTATGCQLNGIVRSTKRLASTHVTILPK